MSDETDLMEALKASLVSPHKRQRNDCRVGYGPDADEDDDSAFEPPARDDTLAKARYNERTGELTITHATPPTYDPQYRAIQSGDGWLLQRAVRAQADGENGGISWEDMGPVNVEEADNAD